MEYLRIKIKPTSAFATKPVSDTFFGQICYTLSLMGTELDEILFNYDTDPFLVVSDFFPLGYAFNPSYPIVPEETLNIAKLANRKKDKDKNRILIETVIGKGKVLDEDLSEPKWKVISEDITHVYINRLTGTTSEGNFTPYNLVDYSYSSLDATDFTFDIYIYVKDEYKEVVIKAIKMVGEIGYGKKSTIGKGHFVIDDIKSVKIDTTGKNSLFTLGQCVISNLKNVADNVYYTPKAKFGKHGVITANGIPFKNPYVLAEQGMTLFNIKDTTIFNKPYIGKAIKGISHTNNTVSQGYSLYIPFMV